MLSVILISHVSSQLAKSSLTKQNKTSDSRPFSSKQKSLPLKHPMGLLATDPLTFLSQAQGCLLLWWSCLFLFCYYNSREGAVNLPQPPSPGKPLQGKVFGVATHQWKLFYRHLLFFQWKLLWKKPHLSYCLWVMDHFSLTESFDGRFSTSVNHTYQQVCKDLPESLCQTIILIPGNWLKC